jgi:hypothetical protein
VFKNKIQKFKIGQVSETVLYPLAATLLLPRALAATHTRCYAHPLLRTLIVTRTRCYAHSLLRALAALRTRCYAHLLLRKLAATRTRCYAHSLLRALATARTCCYARAHDCCKQAMLSKANLFYINCAICLLGEKAISYMFTNIPFLNESCTFQGHCGTVIEL